MAKKKIKIDKKAQSIFASHPTINEIYKDVNGKYWVNKAAAETQGGQIEIIKRT